MRIFVAGATGAVGRRLVPMLVAAGHEVAGTTRTPARVELLRSLGAEPAVVDLLDAAAVHEAVAAARPEVVIHQVTAIPASFPPRRMKEAFAPTNRLRREGTRTLVEAARAAGSRRVVAQSIAFAYAPVGGPVKSEDDPLWLDAPPGWRSIVEAVAELERTVLGAEGIEGVVLRYGAFYGPGTAPAPDGPTAAAVRKRAYPIVGSGAGIFSFVHVDDAARAALLAAERGGPGVYNVVDDDPAPLREWLRAYAAALGAKPPRRVPAWLARLAAGPAAVALATRQRGADNARARRELGWEPAHPSWRATSLAAG